MGYSTNISNKVGSGCDLSYNHAKYYDETNLPGLWITKKF